MKYAVNINYKVGKICHLTVPEDSIKQFFSDISSGQVWINKETEEGFWTNFNEVRNIIIKPIKKDKDNGQVTKT